MCGIAGIVHPDTAARALLARRMIARIRHRGPDHEDVWAGQGCVLAHARLSIIDLSETGNQPMSNEDGSIWVVLNGEIYNYVELADELRAKGHVLRGTSDTEVIPHLYEEHGEGFVTRLRGMFAIALWDQTRRKLLLARDRVGKKPLFFAAIPGGFAFASEMKALFPVPGVDLEVRDQGIHDYLTFGDVPGPDTVYRGIHRVAPATVLARDDTGTVRHTRYWSPEYLPKIAISAPDAEAEISRLLRDSVRLRLRGDVPVGCFLSGGIDSGLVTAMASEMLDTPLKTFSVGFDDDAFDERPLAAKVAERYGTDHTELLLEARLGDDLARIIAHYDEPFADPSAVPSFAVAQAASGNIKVVLNGDGADEVFCGYRHFIAARRIAAASRLGASAGRRACAALARYLPAAGGGRSTYQFIHRTLRAMGCREDEQYSVLTADLLDEADKAALYGSWRDLDVPPLLSALRHIAADRDAIDGLGPVDAMLFRDFRHLLGDAHLVKMDIASMAHSLEARSPFMDHELVEFVARLPESVKLPGATTKPLLRGIAGRWLPDEVVNAPKRGFEIPLLRWMRDDLNGMLIECVTDPGSYAMAHFDRDQLDHLLSGKGWDAKRWAAVVWALLCLEIWWVRYRSDIRVAATLPVTRSPISNEARATKSAETPVAS
jgi:asparagine synthase (glutamine-hydrolysing)